MPPVPLRALPCVPQLGLGGGSGGLHPQAVLQGKLGFPSKGCSPVGQGWGAQGPWLSLGWWLGATEAQSSDSRGAVTPLSLWGWGWFGGSNPSLCSPWSCFVAGERLVQHHHHVQLVTRSIHSTP